MKNKRDCQMKHSIRRASERYNLSLTDETFAVLNNSIRDPEKKHAKYPNIYAEYVAKQSNRVSFWRIFAGKTELKVVYDKQRNVIVTFLPPEADMKELAQTKRVFE